MEYIYVYSIEATNDAHLNKNLHLDGILYNSELYNNSSGSTYSCCCGSHSNAPGLVYIVDAFIRRNLHLLCF